MAENCSTCARLALACDNAWANYRAAREKLAKNRDKFAAQQRFIDASAAVARTLERYELHNVPRNHK